MVTIISLSHKVYQNHCAFKNVAYFSTCRVWICLCVLWLNLSTLIIKMELPHVVNRGNMVTANLCSITCIYMYIVLCTVNILLGSSCSCFYGSWIYNYLCLSPLALWGVLDTTLCDKVCSWLAAGRWFSPATPVPSTNITDPYDIAEILLKVTLTLSFSLPWFVLLARLSLLFYVLVSLENKFT